MIKGVFIINNNGKPRLIKCYEHMVRNHSELRSRRRQQAPPVLLLVSLNFSCKYRFRFTSAYLQTEDAQQGLVREIFSLLAKRSDAVCNFLEGGR